MNRIIISILLVGLLGGCSSLLSGIPNPFKEDKGLEVSAQVGKNNTQVKKRQLVEATVNTEETNNVNNDAESIKIINSNTEVYMIVLLCLFAGMAIPTRGQYSQIKMLKESLKYERNKIQTV